MALDDATNAPYADGWQTGDNGGVGLGAWTLNGPANTSQGGFFIGDSTANGGAGTGAAGQSGGINTPASTKSFGLYANSGQTAEAVRSLIGALASTDTLSFKIDNGYIANGGAVGVSLRAGASNRLEFFFNGGGSAYTINDASGAHSSGIGYTDGGLTLAFSPTSASTYSLVVTPNGGSPSTFTGSLIGSPSSNDVDTFRAFDFNSQNNTAGNFYVNSLTVVPEPGSVAAVAAGLGLLTLGRSRRRVV